MIINETKSQKQFSIPDFRSLLNLKYVVKKKRFFPNWQNSLPIASWQMIGHTLLSTNVIPCTLTSQVGVIDS